MIDAKTWDNNLPRWTQNNADAQRLVRDLFSVAHTWDDLIDRDKNIAGGAVNAAFRLALVDIPRNAFYQANFARLSPIVETAILDWLAANEFEKSGEPQKLILAYGLRFSPLSLVTAAASIIGGADFAQQVTVECKSIVETWDAYALEHGVT